MSASVQRDRSRTCERVRLEALVKLIWPPPINIPTFMHKVTSSSLTQ